MDVQDAIVSIIQASGTEAATLLTIYYAFDVLSTAVIIAGVLFISKTITPISGACTRSGKKVPRQL